MSREYQISGEPKKGIISLTLGKGERCHSIAYDLSLFERECFNKYSEVSI